MTNLVANGRHNLQSMVSITKEDFRIKKMRLLRENLGKKNSSENTTTKIEMRR